MARVDLSSGAESVVWEEVIPKQPNLAVLERVHIVVSNLLVLQLLKSTTQ